VTSGRWPGGYVDVDVIVDVVGRRLKLLSAPRTLRSSTSTSTTTTTTTSTSTTDYGVGYDCGLDDGLDVPTLPGPRGGMEFPAAVLRYQAC
jgi:hypothetical protein